MLLAMFSSILWKQVASFSKEKRLVLNITGGVAKDGNAKREPF